MNGLLNELQVDKIYFEDCITGVAERIPDKSIDLIIADPPFAIDFGNKQSAYNRLNKNVIDEYNEIPLDEYPQFSESWLKQAYRVLKNTGSLFIFSGWSHIDVILNALNVTRFKRVNHLIYKYQFGVYTKRKFVTSHLDVIFCVKNKTKYFFKKLREDEYIEDVWYIKRPYDKGKEKNANKLPIKIIEKILDYCSKEGDLILDMFVGNGTVPSACLRKGRKFVGFEINRKLKYFLLKRIAMEEQRAAHNLFKYI